MHAVAAIEGSTISSSAFLTEYGDNIDSVGEHSVNLSALTLTNAYSALTSSNGAGLKNYGLTVDPTVSAFTESDVSESLDAFITNVTLPGNFGVQYLGDCYGLSGETTGVANIVVEQNQLIDNICDDEGCPTCPTPTPSVSATVSVSLTQTPSVSITPTPSVSLTQTPSVSLTQTPSVSLTQTPSVSITQTPSVSITPTPSVSLTQTPSVSLTQTPSVSLTQTPSVSITQTPLIVTGKQMESEL